MRLWPRNTVNRCLSRNPDSSDEAMYFQSSTALVSVCLLQPQSSVLGWQEWDSLWSSAVVASSFDSICLRIFSARHSYDFIWVTVAFLSAPASLAILLWPLTSTSPFLAAELTLWMFFTSYWMKCKDRSVWRFQEIRDFRNTQTSRTGTNNHVTLCHWDHIFILVFIFDLIINWSAWPLSEWSHVLRCCHMIGWLDTFWIIRSTGVRNRTWLIYRFVAKNWAI